MPVDNATQADPFAASESHTVKELDETQIMIQPDTSLDGGREDVLFESGSKESNDGNYDVRLEIDAYAQADLIEDKRMYMVDKDSS